MSWTWLGMVTAAFLAACCWAGYRRGFVREIVSTFFVLLSLALVWVINPYVNKFLRENTSVCGSIQSGCEDLVNRQAENLMGMNAQAQEGLLDQLPLPGLLVDGLKTNNTAEVYQMLAVNTFSEYVSGYLSSTIINGLSFAVSFVLATLLIRMVTYALNVLSRLPVLKGVNRMAGALVGAAKGVLFVWVALLLVTVFCSTQAGGSLLAMVRKDYFLNLLYENDIFVRVFMSIFYGNA